MTDKLVYKAPPVNKEVEVRRLYMLPARLVKQVHEYGYENGHQNEVSAVRELLELALRGGFE